MHEYSLNRLNASPPQKKNQSNQINIHQMSISLSFVQKNKMETWLSTKVQVHKALWHQFVPQLES